MLLICIMMSMNNCCWKCFSLPWKALTAFSKPLACHFQTTGGPHLALGPCVVYDVIWTNVSTRSKLHLQPMTTRLSYLLNPFLLATALTNKISSFLYINQLGSISTSFWRYPLKSVRRKALGWISYFTPSSSSVPPNVFSKQYLYAVLPGLVPK